MKSSSSIKGNYLDISHKIANGALKKFFICHRPSKNSEPKLYVGTNEANWEGLPEISEIRRADRDLRLAEYIPFCRKGI